jgi:hypothetical protein
MAIALYRSMETKKENKMLVEDIKALIDLTSLKDVIEAIEAIKKEGDK